MTLIFPTRFYGVAMLDGKPAPAGTEVQALVAGIPAGTGSVKTSGTDLIYVVDAMPAQAAYGVTVTFTVRGARAEETAPYQPGAVVEHNLNARTGQVTGAGTGAPPTPLSVGAGTPTGGGAPAAYAPGGGVPPADATPPAGQPAPSGRKAASASETGTSGAGSAAEGGDKEQTGGTGDGGATGRRR